VNVIDLKIENNRLIITIDSNEVDNVVKNASNGVREYEIKLPLCHADNVDLLVDCGLYPSPAALFISMIEWWLNQPSTRKKVEYALEWKQKYIKKIRGDVYGKC